MLRDTVRKFVDRELIPIERTARVNNKLKPEVRADLVAKAAALGLAGYDVPREYGGLGMGLVAKVTVWAELGRSIALPSRGVDIFGPNVSPILYHLNDAQKAKYLLPTIRGELNWCLAQTEPDAGGDPGSMRTTAVRHGDHYVINGVKRFITGADEAALRAVDRGDRPRQGLTRRHLRFHRRHEVAGRDGFCVRRNSSSTTVPGKSPSRTSKCRSRIASAKRATASSMRSIGSMSGVSGTVHAASA